MLNYSIDELVKECSTPKLIALLGRDDEENTVYAIEVCKLISKKTDRRIIYFSLKSETKELRKRFEELPFEVDDTAGLEVTWLVGIVPLSKYVPMDYSILQEFNQYGYIKPIIDVIAYVDSQEKEHPINILKNENSYIHYGSLTFDSARFEAPDDLVYRNKPSGGFWASHCKSENSWKKWCEDNNYHKHCDDRVSFYFHLSPEAHILSIATLEDCKRLPRRRTGYEFMRTEPLQIEAINYKECVENGIDAIEYKYDIASQSEDFEEINSIMWGWDCDSILILNPDIIVLPEKMKETSKK